MSIPIAARRRSLYAFVALALVAYAIVLTVAARRWSLPPLDGRAWAFLIVAVVFQFLTKFAYGLLFWESVRKSGAEISLRAAFRAALVGSGVARLIPAGGALTPAAMAWAVRDEASGTAGAALRATTLNYAGLLTLTGLALVWARESGTAPAVTAATATIGALMALAGFALFVGPRWFGTLADRLPARIRSLLGPTMVNQRVDMRDLVILVARLTFEAATLGFALAAFGIRLSPFGVFAAFGISQLLGGLPGSPGGLGITEAGLVGALVLFGLPAGDVVAPVLVYRIISYWIPAAAGLLAGGAAWAAQAQAVVEGRDAPPPTMPDGPPDEPPSPSSTHDGDRRSGRLG